MIHALVLSFSRSAVGEMFMPSAVYRVTIIYTKNYWNRKGDRAWGGSGWWTLFEKICRSQSTNQSGKGNERLPDLCFSICRFSLVRFIPRAQPHAQSLFLFPIVFGIIGSAEACRNSHAENVDGTFSSNKWLSTLAVIRADKISLSWGSWLQSLLQTNPTFTSHENTISSCRTPQQPPCAGYRVFHFVYYAMLLMMMVMLPS